MISTRVSGQVQAICRYLQDEWQGRSFTDWLHCDATALHPSASQPWAVCDSPPLQVGADDDGYAVRMKLKHYLEYVHSEEHAVADDSPLYIFDGTFASRRGSCSMRKEYSVPAYFREDLMSLAGEKRRPPYRSCTFPLPELHISLDCLRQNDRYVSKAVCTAKLGNNVCRWWALVKTRMNLLTSIGAS